MSDIIIYQTNQGTAKIEVKLQDENVWLTQLQLVELYKTSKSNISEHIKHIFQEGELVKDSVVRKFRTTALDRQILDLYATAVDYNPNSSESFAFFKIVQNKLHFAAHGKTAAEVIYFRVDSEKPFAGLTNFKGSEPTAIETMVAKNYLHVDELKILNNLVSAYFDLAEINAIEEKPMNMADYIEELDRILSLGGKNYCWDQDQ